MELLDFDDLRDINDDDLPFGEWNVNEVANRIENPTLRDRLRLGTHRAAAAKLLRQLWHAGDEITNMLVTVRGAYDIEKEEHVAEIRDLIRSQTDALRKTKEDARQVAGRIDLAIEDFHAAQSKTEWSRREEPYGIVLSPYQFERMRWRSGFNRVEVGDDMDRRSARTYKDFPIFTAKGLSGPIVLSKTAFDGLSRQAPELNLSGK